MADPASDLCPLESALRDLPFGLCPLESALLRPGLDPMKLPIAQWLQKRPVRPEDYVGDDEARNEQVVREGFVVKAKRSLNRLPLAHETVAMYFCLLDPRT